MSRKGLIIALLVSLAVNLFVIGGVAGMALMEFRMLGGPPPGPPRPPTFAMAEDISATLAPEHREAWMTTMREAASNAGPRLRQSHDIRREAWGKLAADPVSAQAVLAELGQARDLEGQARSDIDRTVVTFAASLPADERKRLADKLAHSRFGPRMFSRGGPGPDRQPPLPPLPDR